MKVYADTSVYGGVFDSGFEDASREFFDGVRTGRFELAVSYLVAREIRRAREEVRALYFQLAGAAETIEPSPQSDALRDAYLARGVVTVKSGVDAEHVALATVGGCWGIISWDYKDIVRQEKAAGYHAVNRENGYNPLIISTPKSLQMSVQQPEIDSEYNPDWLRGDPEWRRDLQEYRAMRAAMTPEEEKAHQKEEIKIFRREIAEARRAAAARREAETARRGGAYPTAPMYAGDARG